MEIEKKKNKQLCEECEEKSSFRIRIRHTEFRLCQECLEVLGLCIGDILNDQLK